MPHMWGVVTARTALAAMAASAAPPPAPQERHPRRRRQVVDRADHAGRGVVGGQRSPVGHSVTVMANPSPRPGLPAAAIDELRGLIGADAVVTDPDRLASVEVDWTGRFRGSAPVLLRPRTVDEVSAVLAWCHDAAGGGRAPGRQHGPGGRGSAAARRGRARLGRLDAIGEPSTSWPRRSPPAPARRWVPSRPPRPGTDCATRSTSRRVTRPPSAAWWRPTPAGSTCCGGRHARQLLGVEAVLADGRIVSHLGGLEKDNTGYDLAQLLCGSEGTLAVVTAARLRLVPAPTELAVALLGVRRRRRRSGLGGRPAPPAPGAAGRGAGHGGRRRPRVPGVRAATALRFSLAGAGCWSRWRRPVIPPRSGRRSGQGPGQRPDRSAAWPAGRRGRRARRRRGRRRRGRSRPGRALGRPGGPRWPSTAARPHKPTCHPAARRTGPVLADVPACAAWPGRFGRLFGHAADGNVHVNVDRRRPDDDRVDEAVLAAWSPSAAAASAPSTASAGPSAVGCT